MDTVLMGDGLYGYFWFDGQKCSPVFRTVEDANIWQLGNRN